MKVYALTSIILVLLGILPLMDVYLPVASPYTHDNQVTSVLQAGQYYYVSLVPKGNLLLYAVTSNVSVVTAVFDNSGFHTFNSTGQFQGYLTGTDNYSSINGLLVNPGQLYFIVVYSPTYVANFTLYWNYITVTFVNSTQSFCEDVFLQPGGQASFPIRYITVGSPSNISLMGISNSSLVYCIVSQDGAVVYQSGQNTLLTSNYQVGVNLTLPQGIYYLNILNPGGSPVRGEVAYSIFPDYVNPYLTTLIRNGSYPMGIASYGVMNGTEVSTYTVRSNEILGVANISALRVYDPYASTYNVSPYSVSLQLNAVLKVETANNSTQYYWPQDVVYFITNQSSMVFLDNILNVSGDNATLINSTVQSQDGGYVAPTQGQQYYGIYQFGPEFNYSLPLDLVLVMNATPVQDGVWVWFGVGVLRNGTVAYQPPVVDWFDKVLLKIQGVKTAYFVVSGKRYTPAGVNPNWNFLDAELVFGGGGNGASARVESLRAVLGLFYLNGTRFTPFPSYYSFGGDTAEGVTNVSETYLGNGYVESVNGTDVLMYLGKGNSSASDLQPPHLIFSSTSAPTTPSTAQVTVSAPNSSSTSYSNQPEVDASQASSSRLSIFPGFSVTYIWLTLILLLLFGAILLISRCKSYR